MARWLKGRTAGTVIIGPFLDATDGVTPETALAGTMDVRFLRLSSGTPSNLARNSATAITHLFAGFYAVPVNATDLDELGQLILAVNNPTVHLPVWHEFVVVYADTFTSLVVGDASLLVDAAVTAASVTSIRDSIASKVVETQGSYTLQQALSVILSAVAGVTTNNGATLKTPNGVATRVVATVDNATNQRTAMTLTPSS